MDKGFSIIIPAYNEEKAITELLNSIIEVLKARKEIFEIIVIDAGSSDKTSKVSDVVLGQSGIDYRIIRADTRIYPGAARNAGIGGAKFENLIFIDCGSSLSNEIIDTIIGNCKKFEFIWFESNFKFENIIQASYVRPYFAKKRKGRYLRHCMINKNVFSKTGYFREDLRAAEDWLFYRNIKKRGFRELFSGVTVEFEGYPKSMRTFFRKWVTYFEHSVYAGLHYKNIVTSMIQIFFILLVFLICLVLGVHWIISVVIAVLMYILARGIYSFFRSGILPKGLKDIINTLISSCVFEASRIAGIVLGLKNDK